jgi:hypothetical protein
VTQIALQTAADKSVRFDKLVGTALSLGLGQKYRRSEEVSSGKKCIGAEGDGNISSKNILDLRIFIVQNREYQPWPGSPGC